MAANTPTVTTASGEVSTGVLTIDAATVDTITFDSHVPVAQIVFLDGTDEWAVSADGSTPSLSSKKSRVFPASIGAMDVRMPAGQNAVKVITASSQTYVVQVPPS